MAESEGIELPQAMKHPLLLPSVPCVCNYQGQPRRMELVPLHRAPTQNGLEHL